MPGPLIANAPLNLPLTEKRKELMHRVMDGNMQLAGTMHMLHHYNSCDAFLKWLVAHNFTGVHLQQLLVKRFGSSVPKLVDYIVRDCKGTTALRSKTH